jgi:hypothetical protein
MSITVDWKQVGSAAAVAAAMALPIYGSGGQVNTLAGRYSAPLALAVSTGVSAALSQIVVEQYDPFTAADINQSPMVAMSDLVLYSGAIAGVANAAMYMNDRPGVAAAIGASSHVLGGFVATSLFGRK